MIIRSRSPVRISFGGGGTDLSPYTDTYGGAVLSATINKYVYVTLVPKKTGEIRIVSADYKQTYHFSDLNKLTYGGDLDLIKNVIVRMKPDFGFDLFLRSDIPPNTGLGSSGAVTTALIGAFNHLRDQNKLNRYEIAEMAFQVESTDMNNVGGRQDQYAASFGGFNFLEFNKDDFVRVIPVNIAQDYILELEKHLILAFVGPRGPSGEIQSMIVDQQINPTNQTSTNEKTAILHQLKKFCHEMHIALANGHLDQFGELLDKAWQLKRSLSSKISNEHINNIYEQAKLSGAIGGKITGAGGGGCMIFFCRSNQEHHVAQALQDMGVKVIDFSFDHSGLVTWQLSREHRQDIVSNNEHISNTQAAFR